MSRYLARRAASFCLLASALGLTFVAPNAHAHGDEAAFHDVSGVAAPSLRVSATSEGSLLTLHLDTTNFTWAAGTEVENFTAGEGIARVYLNSARVARLFSPDVTFDTRAWNLAPGTHDVTVVLTGSDLVSYAANGHEVEVTVPMTISEPAATTRGQLDAPAGSAVRVSALRDPFGGWTLSPTISGFGETGADLEFAIDGTPWARSSGESIHVYPESILGKGWETDRPLPEISVRVLSPAGDQFVAEGEPVLLSFSAPKTDQAVSSTWTSESGSPSVWIPVMVAVLVVAFALTVLIIARRRTATLGR